MWQPEPGWVPVHGGMGPSTVGVWRSQVGGRPILIKRLARPQPHDPAELSDRRHFAYWRRAADVLDTGLVRDTPGLRTPEYSAVAEDEEGITVVTEWVENAANSGLFCAMALGRFAGAPITHVKWLARNQLPDRMARVARRGGWRTLARTTAADIAEHLWSRREALLEELDALPQVAQHGDPTPENLPGREGDDVLAIDWATLGTGPVGGDLGYFALGARETFEPLLDAYVIGLPEGLATREQVAQGARVTAVLTALSRAEWALARVAGGEGALAAKFRHPSVAPYLRSLQRQAPQIEDLLRR